MRPTARNGDGEEGSDEAEQRAAGGDAEQDDERVQLDRPAVDDGGEQVVVELLHDDRDSGDDERRDGTRGDEGDEDGDDAGGDGADDRDERSEERDDHHRDDEAGTDEPQGEADRQRFDDTQDGGAAEISTGGVPARSAARSACWRWPRPTAPTQRSTMRRPSLRKKNVTISASKAPMTTSPARSAPESTDPSPEDTKDDSASPAWSRQPSMSDLLTSKGLSSTIQSIDVVDAFAEGRPELVDLAGDRHPDEPDRCRQHDEEADQCDRCRSCRLEATVPEHRGDGGQRSRQQGGDGQRDDDDQELPGQPEHGDDQCGDGQDPPGVCGAQLHGGIDPAAAWRRIVGLR